MGLGLTVWVWGLGFKSLGFGLRGEVSRDIGVRMTRRGADRLCKEFKAGSIGRRGFLGSYKNSTNLL